MPIRTEIWKVGAQPEQLVESHLPKEQLLEQMILASPKILSEEWMLIGQQEDTGYGGRIDLLAIAPDGSLVLIELKRSRTPRDVVAQSLDYATWVEKLRAEDVAAIYRRFAPAGNLALDFRQRFEHDLDEDAINQSHQIIIVAASLDDSTERIVAYLSERGIPMNVLCFQVFTCGGDQLLSRSWLLDPVRTQASAAETPVGPTEPWNGEFYSSFGHGPERSWEDAREYGFICAGGGPWYSKTLQLLSPEDRVWVNIPSVGFVGVGRVEGRAQPASSFLVKTGAGELPVLDVLKRANYHRQFVGDPEYCEYFVPIRWLDNVPAESAVREIGLFGNQNSVCKPTTSKWRSTIDRLKDRFPGFDN
ncbi:MAG: DUF91 domain-containing protein [Acidobacteria bacterium]|nr:DUF91 domain-containing protein [Acidobacteriota bacterium]